MTVSGGYQSQTMWLFPFNLSHFWGDFDHGKIMRPVIGCGSKGYADFSLWFHLPKGLFRHILSEPLPILAGTWVWLVEIVWRVGVVQNGNQAPPPLAPRPIVWLVAPLSPGHRDTYVYIYIYISQRRQELQVLGERLQYRRKAGSGPEEGWARASSDPQWPPVAPSGPQWPQWPRAPEVSALLGPQNLLYVGERPNMLNC